MSDKFKSIQGREELRGMLGLSKCQWVSNLKHGPTGMARCVVSLKGAIQSPDSPRAARTSVQS